ncbi:MAG: glycosyltransferase, partial [Bryobacteraceae bacterium]
MLFLNPPPAIVADETAATGTSDSVTGPHQNLRQFNAVDRIEQFMRYSGLTAGRLLIAGSDRFLVQEAQRRKFEVVAVNSMQLEDGTLDNEEPGQFDGCVLFCSLERTVNPGMVLETVRRLLRHTGVLMVIAPTLDSSAARRFGAGWWEFHRKNRFYFSVDTLQNLLVKTGFGDPIVGTDRSAVSLQYLREKAVADSSRLRRAAVGSLARMSPKLARDYTFRLAHSRTFLLCRRRQERRSPKLSVIVPVYNERATFNQMIDQLLAKEIPGVEIEIIIVESFSSDGTRDDVLRYRTHPRVKLILEDRPQGKGHAVRAGLQCATGEVVLIQDADLEYDMNDYDALIAPILRGEHNFVIGSRHNTSNSSWKMRHFEDAKSIAAVFNLGHVIFLNLFNVLYGQKLTDPFSMFKVFRRDCLYGLAFECNRFDFDFEIAIKLIRKGYRPIELPVNYQSRSLSEGKKVRMFRDPLTWIRALLKFRKSPIYSSGMRS